MRDKNLDTVDHATQNKTMSEKIRAQIINDKELAATVERVVPDSTKGKRITLDRIPEATKLLRNKRQAERIKQDRTRKRIARKVTRSHRPKKKVTARKKATKKRKK